MPASFRAIACALALAASGCATTPELLVSEPTAPPVTATRDALVALPAGSRKIEVAVYDFEDLTGQFKPSDTFQTLSKAVSQGGAAVLVKALRDAGEGRWFTVVERANLSNLLQERKIIQEMRSRYLGEKTVNAKALPPMLFAGLLIEGGVIGYDSNTVTGGAGARLLGIGAKGEYRQDTISINLRTVSVKTGEVLSSVVVQKTLISAGISASAFRYIDFDEILELEAGVTTNEPGLVALTRAIEKGVYMLVMEGVSTGLWSFAEAGAAEGEALVRDYRVEQGRITEAEARTLAEAAASEPEPTPARPASEPEPEVTVAEASVPEAAPPEAPKAAPALPADAPAIDMRTTATSFGAPPEDAATAPAAPDAEERMARAEEGAPDPTSP